MPDESNIVPVENNADNGIPDDLQELIEGVVEQEIGEEKARKVTRQIIAITEEHFSGPLPHPRILEHYKRVLDSAPERILTMAEQQQQHRIFIEKAIVVGGERRANWGLILGFVLFLVLAVGSIYLLATGSEISGYVLLVGAITGAVISLVNAVSIHRREVESTAPQKQDTPKPETSREKQAVRRPKNRKKSSR